MTDTSERWQAVGDAIAARLDELEMTRAEFLRKSGISDKTLARYIDGNPIVRKDKKRELCKALGWWYGSIERILEGDEPIVIPPVDDRPPPTLEEQIEEANAAFSEVVMPPGARTFEERLSKVEDDYEELSTAVRELLARLEAGSTVAPQGDKGARRGRPT